MSGIKKFIVATIIIALVAGIIWALDMVDLLLGFLVLSLCLFVAVGLLRESSYEFIRTFVSEGGFTNSIKESLREMAAE